MRKNSIWKKIILLTFGSVFALHMQVVSASEDAGTIKTESGDEECVITEDQYKRI